MGEGNILITGGTGSFGIRFVETVLGSQDPERLIIYSRGELKQFEMQKRFPVNKYPCMRYRIGDVRDVDRLTEAMRGVDTVVHAAALKQVPMAEVNPFEVVQTNVLGAQNVIRAAIACHVKHVIALSSDKAAAPLNMYGATKLCSDKLFVAGNIMSDPTTKPLTRFSVVRYGNVMGSRGSVIPFFKKLVEQGEALPITHVAMTRFWITLQQGVDFVLKCLELMRGGEVFVPKIPSCSMVDLARAIGPNSQLVEVGIRAGEKIHEVMVPKDVARHTLELDDMFVIEPVQHWWTGHDFWTKDAGGVECAEGFEYSSDNNPDRLTIVGIDALLEQM